MASLNCDNRLTNPERVASRVYQVANNFLPFAYILDTSSNYRAYGYALSMQNIRRIYVETNKLSVT